MMKLVLFFLLFRALEQLKLLFACQVALPVTNEHAKPGCTMQGHRVGKCREFLQLLLVYVGLRCGQAYAASATSEF